MRILLFLLIVETAVASDTTVPERIDGSGLFVRLELPWTTLMVGESIQCYFVLENASEMPTPVALPTLKHGLLWPSGGQPYFEGFPQDHGAATINFQKPQWPPTGAHGEGIAGWGKLLSGYRITWNRHQVTPDGEYGIFPNKHLKGLRAHWLIGHNRWVSSERVDLKMEEVPRSERKNVFTAQWKSYHVNEVREAWVRHRLRRIPAGSVNAYTVLIDGSRFLFCESYRICKVPEDAEFEHKVDEHNTNIEITIKSAIGTRKVYYHVRNGFSRNTPWPIGPVILNYPKPEPIPPVELEELRKIMIIKAAQDAADQPATR